MPLLVPSCRTPPLQHTLPSLTCGRKEVAGGHQLGPGRACRQGDGPLQLPASGWRQTVHGLCTNNTWFKHGSERFTVFLSALFRCRLSASQRLGMMMMMIHFRPAFLLELAPPITSPPSHFTYLMPPPIQSACLPASCLSTSSPAPPPTRPCLLPAGRCPPPPSPPPSLPGRHALHDALKSMPVQF